MLAAADVNPVSFDGPNMLWGAVFFLMLLILMYTVCLPPVRRAMRQREQQREGDLELTERAGYEAEQVRRDYDTTLADARAEAGRIVERARHDAEEERTRRVAAVEAELAASRQQVMSELDVQRARALESITADVTELASAAASQIVRKTLDPASQRASVDEFVASATRR